MIRQALGMLVLATASVAAGQNSDRQALQQRLAAVKESIVRNQAKLRPYSWTESTQISVKGKVKKLEQNECRYGPDGHVMKTRIGAGPSGAKLPGDMDRIGSLILRYVPPEPGAMQEAFQAGKASLDKASGTLTFRDYAKPGDSLTLAFDQASRRLRSFEVTTFLDEPRDVATINGQFSKLPDGANFLEEYEFNSAGKQIRIKTTNFGHTK
jgi:hypothetical protein